LAGTREQGSEASAPDLSEPEEAKRYWIAAGEAGDRDGDADAAAAARSRS
jgi:hypothetical protein